MHILSTLDHTLTPLADADFALRFANRPITPWWLRIEFDGYSGDRWEGRTRATFYEWKQRPYPATDKYLWRVLEVAHLDIDETHFALTPQYGLFPGYFWTPYYTARRLWEISDYKIPFIYQEQETTDAK